MTKLIIVNFARTYKFTFNAPIGCNLTPDIDKN